MNNSSHSPRPKYALARLIDDRARLIGKSDHKKRYEERKRLVSELIDFLEISHWQFRRYLNFAKGDNGTIPQDKLVKLADYFRVSVDEMINRSPQSIAS